jgi:hypothetical protein
MATILVVVMFMSVVMADGAPGRSAKQGVMVCEVARHAANNGAAHAAPRFGLASDQSQGDHDQGNERFHSIVLC